MLKLNKVTMNDTTRPIPQITKRLIKNFNILDMEMTAIYTVAPIVGVETLHHSNRGQWKIVKLDNVILAEYIQRRIRVRYCPHIITIFDTEELKIIFRTIVWLQNHSRWLLR